MNTETIEQLVQAEYDARATLREAGETYRLESLTIRQKLGGMFAAKREAIGFSQAQCAGLLGVVRQKIQSIESPEKVVNPFGVSMYCEMLRVIDELAKISAQIPKVKRGRIKGDKISVLPTE